MRVLCLLAFALTSSCKKPPTPAGPPQAPVTRPSGLITQVLVPGDGDPAKKGDKLQVHFVGRLLDGGVFDSSRARNAPFSFWVGEGQVIAGWDEGLLGMKEGETRQLVVPPLLGYGSDAKPGIPPNSTLVFDIELLDVR
ncbi:MAG: FKBP-type peptidyl-prolyl cis-trans isomerase [Myxococcus sp.]|nr:FKBP-type peptidyl-prolyl cis-trans isomerase [Myxococcus sp.]